MTVFDAPPVSAPSENVSSQTTLASTGNMRLMDKSLSISAFGGAWLSENTETTLGGGAATNTTKTSEKRNVTQFSSIRLDFRNQEWLGRIENYIVSNITLLSGNYGLWNNASQTFEILAGADLGFSKSYSSLSNRGVSTASRSSTNSSQDFGPTVSLSYQSQKLGLVLSQSAWTSTKIRKTQNAGIKDEADEKFEFELTGLTLNTSFEISYALNPRVELLSRIGRRQINIEGSYQGLTLEEKETTILWEFLGLRGNL